MAHPFYAPAVEGLLLNPPVNVNKRLNEKEVYHSWNLTVKPAIGSFVSALSTSRYALASSSPIIPYLRRAGRNDKGR